MISLNTWSTLYEGKYGNQELNLLYKDDIFVSFLRLRDNINVLLQVYKVFVVKGDIETFVSTLPYPAIVYHKHIDIGAKNNFKYLLLHTEVEYVDINTLSYYVDKKILDLNKMVSTIIPVTKSYNVKLISLKYADKKDNDYFFSDPEVLKTLSNLSLPFMQGSSACSFLDKHFLGKKDDVEVSTSLSNLKEMIVYGSELKSRLFASKVLCESHLLASEQVIVFDDSDFFLSLANPQKNLNDLNSFDKNLPTFGFPVNKLNYGFFKIPLGKIPFVAFVNIFSFKEISYKILSKVYSQQLTTIQDLISKIKNLENTKEINDFEKQRLVSKLLILDKKYKLIFGKPNLSTLFEQKYKNIGCVKIISFDKNDVLYPYYINAVLEEISLTAKQELLLVFPELDVLFNNIYLEDTPINTLKENPNLNFLITTTSSDFFKSTEVSGVKLHSIKNNDAVIYYTNRDPLRFRLRPTFTFCEIDF